jgi:hypothetical protein
VIHVVTGGWVSTKKLRVTAADVPLLVVWVTETVFAAPSTRATLFTPVSKLPFASTVPKVPVRDSAVPFTVTVRVAPATPVPTSSIVSCP